MILIYTFITETVNGTERVIHLETVQVRAVRVIKVCIVIMQHILIQIDDGIHIVREVQAQIYGPISTLYHIVRTELDFPTIIIHRTSINIGYGTKSC